MVTHVSEYEIRYACGEHWCSFASSRHEANIKKIEKMLHAEGHTTSIIEHHTGFTVQPTQEPKA